MSRTRPIGTNVEDICDLVHAMNESVQKQLKEVQGDVWVTRDGQGVVDIGDAVHEVENDDNVQLLQANAEW